MRQIFILAMYIVIEALWTRFFVIIISFLLIGFGITLFIGQVALIEQLAIQSTLLATFLRLGAVYIVSLFVITSMVREFNDQSIYLWLSLPLPRSIYFLGKLLGFIFIAFITATLFGGALAFYTTLQNAVVWTISLLCELIIIATLSLLCVLTFHQIMQAFSAVLSFYILARSISTMQLVAEGHLNNNNSWVDQFINGLIYLLAMMLPSLDQFTQSEWLVYHISGTDLINILGQTVIYVVLLIAMSLFDFYRKNL
jgi:ABC-type transport system involved in multi-copper enzyme maturation permease subunit